MNKQLDVASADLLPSSSGERQQQHEDHIQEQGRQVGGDGGGTAITTRKVPFHRRISRGSCAPIDFLFPISTIFAYPDGYEGYTVREHDAFWEHQLIPNEGE
eukprot:CAMPEP_0116545006 /NCGR_PEP_ID=MMETSP0397-20121206/2429_1 /TAXON_ID=216820 /ORGANISM="Cyclophora tenuis, Strain ECT3854" /LENGTH=101 /DNA_ID=CAMNT_0004069273 /DNA_START=819 /DNA_END=1122 /DNA_ORIENTATION=-